MLQPQAIIFDMDGLMIDSEPLWWRVEKQLAGEHGKTWSDDLARECVGKGLPNVIVTMRRELGIDLEVDAGVAQLVATFIRRIDELELHRGCLELMDAADAASLPMAVASSSTMDLIEAVLSRFEITDRFAATVSGDSVAQAKPAPDIFLRASELLGVPPPSCVVLEDSLAGVRAAIAANIPVIAVPEFDVEQFGPLTDHVVDSLIEARALLGL